MMNVVLYYLVYKFNSGGKSFRGFREGKGRNFVQLWQETILRDLDIFS